MNRIFISLFFLLVLLCAGCQQSVDLSTPEEITKFHHSLYTIDSHTDTPLMLMRPGVDLGVRGEAGRETGKMDIPRMYEGGLDGVFFAVFVGQKERDEEGNRMANERALQIFDSIHAFTNRYPEVELAVSSDDLHRIIDKGNKAIYIGIENGYTIGQDLSMIGKFYQLGARYITLCHTSNNDICDSSTDKDGPEHDGLSEFGKEVVKEMNRLGMMIDVSHISDEAFQDVIAVSKAPVIASHSNAQALCDHPRNLNNTLLKDLAENDGVIQVCLVTNYVVRNAQSIAHDSAKSAVWEKHGNFYELDSSGQAAFRADWYAVDTLFPPAPAYVSDLVDHIDHIVSIIGIDHVGIGTDFDGGAGLTDCNDVTELENITAELLKRGYSKSDIQKIWSGNFLRVMREVEKMKG